MRVFFFCKGVCLYFASFFCFDVLNSFLMMVLFFFFSRVRFFFCLQGIVFFQSFSFFEKGKVGVVFFFQRSCVNCYQRVFFPKRLFFLERFIFCFRFSKAVVVFLRGLFFSFSIVPKNFLFFLSFIFDCFFFQKFFLSSLFFSRYFFKSSFFP